MKSRCVILFTFISQISSYYDDVQEAVYSVQDNFGKILTGVTDVRDAIDCTLLTMEHALDYDESITYSKLCRNEALPEPSYYPQPQADYYTPPPDPALANEVMQGKQLTEDVLDRNIVNTKIDINDTIYDFLKRRSNIGYYEEEAIRIPESIKNENIQLQNNNESEIIRQELGRMEQSQGNETIAVMLKELQLLHNETKKNTNSINEIYHVLVNLLQELNETHTLTNSTVWNKFQESVLHTEKSNNTYQDIEKRFKEWQILENQRFDGIKALLKKQQNSFQNARNAKGRSLEIIVDKNGINNSVSNQRVQYENETITAVKNIINYTTQDIAVTAQTPQRSLHNPTSSLIIGTTMSPKILNNPLNMTSNPSNAISSPQHANVIQPTINSTITVIDIKSSKLMPQKMNELRDNIIIKKTTNTPSLFTTRIIPIVTENSVTSTEHDDYDDFFHSNDEVHSMEAIKSATDVIEESKKSQSIFDKLLKSMELSSGPFE